MNECRLSGSSWSLGFCFHLLSCIMDWLLLLPWIISTLGMNHTAYNGSAARSSHQPWEDTATGSELGLLSARSNCLVNGKLATQTAMNDVRAVVGR